MKVLMLTTNSSLMDGINRHILTIAPVLNNMDCCEVRVCTVFPSSELNETLEKSGVKTYSLNASNGHDLKIFGRFNQVMKDFRPDIVHCHVLALFERIVLATLFRKIKKVRTIHGIATRSVHGTCKNRFELFLNRIFNIKYDANCVVSNGVRFHLFPDGGNGAVYTVYNPLHFGEVPSKKYELHDVIGVGKDTPIIGTSCRIALVKNPQAFTKVMCKVLILHPTAHAVVMGDGSAEIKNELNAIVESAAVSQRFHWLGYRQDAPELVRDLNCFVMTSFSEGLPTSVLEAMANKVPFAMMEGNGGLKDIAELNTQELPICIVVRKGDFEGMADQIYKILTDIGLQKTLADNAYTVGKHNFDKTNVCRLLIDIYNSVQS